MSNPSADANMSDDHQKKMVMKYVIILVAAFIVMMLIQWVAKTPQKGGKFNWNRALMNSLLLPGGLILLYILYWLSKKYL